MASGVVTKAESGQTRLSRKNLTNLTRATLQNFEKLRLPGPLSHNGLSIVFYEGKEVEGASRLWREGKGVQTINCLAPCYWPNFHRQPWNPK